MDKRVRDVRKRIEKRKRESRISRPFDLTDEERYGQPVVTYDRYVTDEKPPLFRKELILLKTFFAACLVLIAAIAFKNPSETLQPIRSFVKQTMTQEFQFAAISKWYEQQFGEPLAILPVEKTKKSTNSPTYAVPATGRVLEKFTENGQGIMVETDNNASVEAMSEGIVIFTGTKEKIGKTVIIQHADGSESWYGNLGTITVKLYDFVEKGKEVGKAANETNGAKGVFYFAIKQGDRFIDPIQVVPFE
ncbi:stage IV sporulation protein FA [Anoxybacillus voinovskiensis]|uniref:Stage IV sporulation protein FA n=1 Tax=Anoxybacteroides voinovskiense TaxID=230470 RepID=A0A840DNM5_9BACL|nr:M23 family metallopeptidase [Anoxybacillus voinovskiensis]MBB4073235.1 stage IV sporulation protein FA [Anoxybacillus voinovskiensis]GGJ67427.1 stage IV sporulation protein FA [Anoxybacillus voinovskiensis]